MNKESCWTVVSFPCDHKNSELESPKGCINCPMIEWLAVFDEDQEVKDNEFVNKVFNDIVNKENENKTFKEFKELFYGK